MTGNSDDIDNRLGLLGTTTPSTEIDSIGHYQTHSLHSPMHEFSNQTHALAAAESALRRILTPAEAAAEPQIDEELLGRVMRGEETPEIDVEALKSVAFGQKPEAETAEHPLRGPRETGLRKEEKMISRRDLLRGMLGDA